jgi:hypothetical protein
MRSRICAWMVTSSAVVGSSGDQEFRVAGERDGDHHPLPHAARELVLDASASGRAAYDPNFPRLGQGVVSTFCGRGALDDKLYLSASLSLAVDDV